MPLVDSVGMTIVKRSLVSVSAVLSLLLGGCLPGSSARVQDTATATPTATPTAAGASSVAVTAPVPSAAHVAAGAADDATSAAYADAHADAESEPEADPEAEPSTTLLFASYGDHRELVIERYRHEQMPTDLRVSYTDELLVASAPLPANVSAPARVWLHDSSGAVCPARVGALRVNVRQLEGDIDSEEDQPQLSARDLVRLGKVNAASIWQTNAEDRLVTAQYTVESGRCEHPVFARTIADKQDVFVASSLPVRAADRAAAEHKFVELSAYKRKRAAYAEYMSEFGEPDQTTTKQNLSSSLGGKYTYQHLIAANGERRLWVSLRAGEPCAFAVRLSALYAWRGTELVLIRAYDEFESANLEALIELQPGADAAPGALPGVELIESAQRTRFWGEETRHSSGDSVEVPSHRCSC
jgi:hypothetical protein